MKVKKLLALVLSAVMAMSMLTACGGGNGVKNVSVSNSEVEAIFAAENIEVNVKTTNTAKTAAKAIAGAMRELNSNVIYEDSTKQILANALINSYPSGDYVGNCYYITRAEMEAVGADAETVAASAVATFGQGKDFEIGVVEVETKDGVSCIVAVALMQR